MHVRSAALLMAVFGFAAVVPASVLYSNTSTTASGSDNATSTNYVASAFTTGSATSTLSASLLLQQVSSGVDTVSVYSSSTYTPNALVGTLTATSTPSSSSAGLVTYTSSGLSLTANTTYWVVLSSTGSVAWSYSADPTLTDAWAQYSTATSTWYATGDSYPYVFSVSDTATAVPEPAMLGLAAAGVGLLWRKRA